MPACCCDAFDAAVYAYLYAGAMAPPFDAPCDADAAMPAMPAFDDASR